MSEVKKLKIGNTSYDIVDSTAAHNLTDLATAGSNITFTTPLLVNYTIVGSDVTVDGSGIASGFTSSSYITSTSNIWNSLIEGGYFELVTKFKMTSMSATNSLVEQESNGGTPFHLYIDQYGRANVDVRRSNSSYLQTQSAAGLFSDNTDYWIKVIFSASSFIAIYKSTDGTTWGSAIASNSLSTSLDTNGNSNYHLALGARYNRAGMQNPANPLQGSIDLTETYFKDANGNILWTPVTVSSKPSINATVPTVDQTYNSSSANAQSGVAIAGAGFLTKNVDQVAIGTSSSVGSQGVAIGYSARGTGSLGVAIGFTSTAYRNNVAIGNHVEAVSGERSIAIGCGGENTTTYVKANGGFSIAIGAGAKATGDGATCLGGGTEGNSVYSLALGNNAKSTATHAIQLGFGTNRTANTMNVGLSDSLNVQLLNSSGNIPAERLGTLPSADGTYVPVLTITSGVPSIAWVAYTP